MTAPSDSALTLCIIVKNDPEGLARAIESCRGIVDAVIVTDTGSTDDTIATAQRLGARVMHFPWCEDFSAAYNACIGVAGTEWVFSLDADEFLAPESRRLIRPAIEREDAMGYDVIRRDLRDRDKPDLYSEMWQLRLFRKRDTTEYIGRIHHQFSPPLEEIAEREGRALLQAPEIRIIHTGYANRDWPTKYRRDVELMELELQDRPGQFYFLVELGIARLRLGDQRGLGHLAEAAAQVMDDARRPGLPRAPFTQLLEWIIAAPQLPAGFPLSRQRAEDWARSAFRDAPPLLWQLARRSFERGDFADSAIQLERLIEIIQNNTYDKLSGFDPKLLGPDPLLNLGVCYTHMGRIEEARRAFEQLLESGSHRESAERNLRLLGQLGPE